MDGDPGQDRPIDIADRWVAVLVEPLLTSRRRMALEDEMATVAGTRPRWASCFFAGVLSDLATTLPRDDPWRRVSARLGALTVGDAPPSQDGAVSGTGAPFGTYLDAKDVVGQAFHYEVDPNLAAVAQPLPAGSAFAVAAGFTGWQRCTNFLQDAFAPQSDQPEPGPTKHVDEVIQIGSRRRVPASGQTLYDASFDAVRWLLHRRRGYLQSGDDGFITESVWRWAYFADDIADGRGINEVLLSEKLNAARLDDGLTDF